MKTKVSIIESERGWGRKVDSIKMFETYEEALAFAEEFNAQNTQTVAPDWYMMAEVEPQRPEHLTNNRKAAVEATKYKRKLATSKLCEHANVLGECLICETDF